MRTTGDYSVANIAPGSGKPFDANHALVSLNDRVTRGTIVSATITYRP